MRILARQDTEVQINTDAHPAIMQKDSVIIYFDNHVIKVTHIGNKKLRIQADDEHNSLCVQTASCGDILLTTIGD